MKNEASIFVNFQLVQISEVLMLILYSMQIPSIKMIQTPPKILNAFRGQHATLGR